MFFSEVPAMRCTHLVMLLAIAVGRPAQIRVVRSHECAGSAF
jgi:hypothetical protein